MICVVCMRFEKVAKPSKPGSNAEMVKFLPIRAFRQGSRLRIYESKPFEK
jgi:hypothetical protein